ncbi:hypothetical protein [Hahella ganghwensis]|uniref:hypothetical protein n=1 Tax=Hahella ganghwensis TaxID=286420 RepID=UPI000380EAFF|nr:hypothetical protein [Hahella ganghwensis]
MTPQYLERYAEEEAAHLRRYSDHFQGLVYDNVLVVPAYAESLDDLVKVTSRVCQRFPNTEFLQVWIINAPDRADVHHLSQTKMCWEACIAQSDLVASFANMALRRFVFGDVLLVDRFSAGRTIPARQGVGLARKVAGDCALVLCHLGVIQSDWLHYTDADALLPDNYFQQTAVLPVDYSAVVYSHVHREEGDDRQKSVMRQYQIKLDQHVEGLRRAGSPHAYHSIGSTIASTFDAYMKVRGMPLKPGGEDFYFLNKLAKIKPILSLDGDPIELSGRVSMRVPFGTGPALRSALANEAARDSRAAPEKKGASENAARTMQGEISRGIEVYHPDIYCLLAIMLAHLSEFWRSRADLAPSLQHLSVSWGKILEKYELSPDLPELWYEEQELMNRVESLLRHSADELSFQRHFHCWFDAFKTLKFIHWWRDRGLASLSVESIMRRSD